MSDPVPFIDTNIVLRYVLHDHDELYARAAKIFEPVRFGDVKIHILESVLAECVYVLTGHYDVSRADTADTLQGLLSYKGVVNQDKDILQDSLNLFRETKLAFVDCVLIAKAHHHRTDILTFDKQLKNIKKQLH